MAVKVKLVLPGNLNSTFLRGDFIQDGSSYFTGEDSVSPLRDQNQTTLTFGFQLADSNTRLPVVLVNVVSLVLSNDPQFDASAKITLANLPYADDTIYRVNLNPLYFFDPTHQSLELSRETVALPSGTPGYFEVTGWPLSADGGLSTVYFQALVESVGGDQASYPDGYGVYDQIFWESDPPSAPGTPVASTPQDGWVGRRVGWTFRSSEESASGLYSSGVARYIGDILEVRDNEVISTLGPSPGSGGYHRTLVPGITAQAISATQYAYNASSQAFSSSASYVPGSSYSISNTSGIAIYGANGLPTGPTIKGQIRQRLQLPADLSSPTWINTGLVVQPGELLHVTAAGEVRFSGDPLITVDPNGGASTIQWSSGGGNLSPASQGSAHVQKKWTIWKDSDTTEVAFDVLPTAGYAANTNGWDVSWTNVSVTINAPTGALVASDYHIFVQDDASGTNSHDIVFTVGPIDGQFAYPEGSYVPLKDRLADYDTDYDPSLVDSSGYSFDMRTWMARGNGVAPLSLVLKMRGVTPIGSDYTETEVADGLRPNRERTFVPSEMGTTMTPKRLWMIFNDVSGEFGDNNSTFDVNVQRIIPPRHPDVAVQASYTLVPQNPATSATVILKAWVTDKPSHSSTADEIAVELTYSALTLPVAKLYRIIGGQKFEASTGGPIREQSTILPDYASAALLQGGTIELYCSSQGDTQMLVEAYFTPSGSLEQSLLLAAAYVPQWSGVAPWAVQSAVMAYTTGGTGTFVLQEMASAVGRFLLDCDLGDCTSDDVIGGSFPTTITPRPGTQNAKWTDAIGPLGDWKVQAEGVSMPGPTIVAPDDTSVTLTAPSEPTMRQVAELQALMPTFSDRARVDVDFSLTSGEFYVAFSPEPVTTPDPLPDGWTSVDLRAMVSRCDPHSGETDEPFLAPTIAVLFSKSAGQIFLCERRYDNTLVTKPLMPYAPSGSETWSVQLSETPPSISGVADGTWLVLRRGGEAVGSERMDAQLVAGREGTGWYVALGVRSDRQDISSATASASVTRVVVSGLLPAQPFGFGDAPGQRHFLKANAGSVYAKPLLGQQLLAGQTDHGGYDFGVRAPGPDTLRRRNANCATTANITLSGLQTIDGVDVKAGYRVLVKDQTDPTQNGMYFVATGAWSRWFDMSTSAALAYGMWVQVDAGTVSRGRIFVMKTPEPTAGYVLGTTPLLWFKEPSVFLQKIVVPTVGAFYTQNRPRLLELKMRITNVGNAIVNPPPPPRIRFYPADSVTGEVIADEGSALTEWLTATFAPVLEGTGAMVPRNDLVQVRLDAATERLVVQPGVAFYVAVEAPAGCELGVANAAEETALQTEIFFDANNAPLPGVIIKTDIVPNAPVIGTGWALVSSLWFKLFSSFAERQDNVYHEAVLQARVRADSHARITSQPSRLSTMVRADLLAPIATLDDARPLIDTPLLPTVRTVTLSIGAVDSDSGMLAFRIARETDNGYVVFSRWQPWSAYLVGDKVNYTIYHYGTWPRLPQGGTGEPAQLSLNAPADGPRRVWVQVMDGMGNIAESYPLTTLAHSIALIDTVPPETAAEFVLDTDGSSTDTFTSTASLIQVTGSDRVSAVKDIRLRQIGAGAPVTDWTGWRAAEQYSRYVLTGADGLKRVEAQARDWGNNAQQATPLWDRLAKLSQKNILFVDAAVWQAPGDTAESLYLSAIRSQTWTSFTLADSQDSFYEAGTAFVAEATSGASFGRRILVRTTDRVTVVVNGITQTRYFPATGENPLDTAPSNTYWVDSERGLIVFQTAPSISVSKTISISRESAVLYRWDGVAVKRVADLGYYGEQVILSLCGGMGYLFLGTGSGNLYRFDGNTVTGPIFTAMLGPTAYPISLLARHRFTFEPEDSIYLGTAGTALLFRAPLSTAHLGVSWTRIAKIDYLDGTHTADITAAASAYDTLFLGTSDSKILRYRRTQTVTNSATIAESLTVSTLADTRVADDDDGSTLPVTSLLASGDQVLAAIGNRPEVWNYNEALIDQPARAEEWSSQVFGDLFSNDPAPWQYYSSDGEVNTRPLTSRLQAASVTDPDTESGFRSLVTLRADAASTVHLTSESGGDWEQAISNKTAWTVEFSMMAMTGTGAQGFQVKDGRYQLDLKLTPQYLTLSSGHNIAQMNLGGGGLVSAMSLGNSVYPARGVKNVWSFSSSAREDRGPYWFGDATTGITAQTQGWGSEQFVTTLAATSETETDTASFSAASRFLRLTIATAGDPIIKQVGMGAGVTVDSGSQILVRLRANTASALSGAELCVAWSAAPTISAAEVRWTRVPLAPTDGWYTYTLRPAWDGTIKALALGIMGLPEDVNRPVNIDIDFIAIATDEFINPVTPNLQDNLTPVRVAADDRRVRVWIGRQETPVFEEDNFLLLPSAESMIRFGKLDPDEAPSLWAWGGIRFDVDATKRELQAPVRREIRDFRLFWRFASAGGVRRLLNHDGTAWAFTDGLTLTTRADNPDDRASKCFSYYPDQQAWEEEDPPYDRIVDGGTSVVRPLAAASYSGTLVVCGQHGNIRYT